MANLAGARFGLGNAQGVDAGALAAGRFSPDNSEHGELVVAVQGAGSLRPVYVRNSGGQNALFSDEPQFDGDSASERVVTAGNHLVVFPAWPGWRIGIRVFAGGPVTMWGQFQHQR